MNNLYFDPLEALKFKSYGQYVRISRTNISSTNFLENNSQDNKMRSRMIPNVVKCVKKQRKFVPWMVKKNHK